MLTATIAVDPSDSGGLKVTLSGDWLLDQTLPGPDVVLDSFRSIQTAGNVEFDSADLGAWDTGLVTTLIAIHKSAEANGFRSPRGWH